MNMDHSLITYSTWAINTVEVTKNICCTKDEGTINHAPGFLAGPSDIRAGWVLETKSRLGAE